MKKYISGAIALVMLFAFAVSGTAMAGANPEKLNVVTTIFPIYDWVREIVGGREGVEIAMLLDSGVDLHSFQPTVQDIVAISTCDVFVYVGGESDEWVADALKNAGNPDMVVVNLVEAMGEDIRMEEIVEGMEPGHEEEEHEDEADEHVWLSLRNAQKLVKVIAAALAEADPDGADAWAANADAYCAKLAGLDARYAAAREAADFDTVLFGDRFPFRYLVDDYDLEYYAAFSGCSAECEASFETIRFLAEKVDELELSAVLTIEGDDHSVAETIVRTAQSENVGVLTMNSLQGVTAAQVAEGVTYLGVMEDNLAVLAQALTAPDNAE